MKLAILGARGIPAKYGGFETFAEELSARLVRLDVEVTVYCEGTGASSPASYRGVKLAYVPSPALGPLTTIFYDLRCLWHARRSYDAVYMLGYGASFFCFIPRLFGSKVLINMDGIEWARGKWGGAAKTYFKVMEFLAMKTPNMIIADAEGIKDHLLRRHKKIPKCAVIPYGAEVIGAAPNPAMLDEWGLRPREYYLVVCRLEPENNVAEIINGFKSSDTRRPLVIAGNHKADTPYVKMLAGNAKERVRFIGAVYDRMKLAALRFHCAAYFHGHTVGGTNPSLLEALSCGNVVVAHDNAFNREVAPQAFYFKDAEKDIPAAVKEIESMTAEKRRSLEEGAKDRIRVYYSWDKAAERYLSLFASLN
ncbi:MAG: DUF1972 domain-containing protein [Deltaproteobacteria bacterium]|nr:DUF1972 domain-containing protein [Deltaproteobacteria bacterium]